MPHAVVLFDEIEKAHPDVTGILLQILDEGTLTDAEGRSVSFRDALVIITSNIGTGSFAGDRIGFGKPAGAGSEDGALRELGRTLRPELLARIDRTVSFDPLDRGSVAKIVRLEISTLKRRLAKRGVTVVVPPSVVAFVTEKSLAPEHGARLVRRNIEKFIGIPVAESILKGSDGRVVISLSGEEIVCGRD
jgi:ATP-dependent Clp protease ATP-binding subunit ClpC